MSEEDVKLPRMPKPYRYAGSPEPIFHQFTGKQMMQFARRAVLSERRRIAGEIRQMNRRQDALASLLLADLEAEKP